MLLPSCVSKGMLRQSVLGTPVDGRYVAKIKKIKKNKAKLYGNSGTNAFLYNMDIGVLFHYAEMYDSSNAYLLRAGEVFDDLFTRSVMNEAAALLTNDNVRPYRSKPYELTALHQLAALNFMAQGKFDEALVEARKMQIYFNEWERTETKSKRYHTDGMFHLFASLCYERVGERDNSLISLFKSVDAYNKGPVKLAPEVGGFAYDRLTAGDRRDDVEMLGVSPDDGPNKWGAKQGEAEIVIVGYAGKGPKMIERNWSGAMVQGGSLNIAPVGSRRTGSGAGFTMASPIVPEKDRGRTKAGTTFFIKLSMPELSAAPSTTSGFEARLEGSSGVFKSVVVNDIDLQAQKALNDNWAATVGRTALRAVVHAIAANEAKRSLRTNSILLNITMSLVTDIIVEQIEKADVRMCLMLPQRITVTRIPVEPGTHNVMVDVRDKHGAVIENKVFDNVTVKRGEKKVLFCKSFL